MTSLKNVYFVVAKNLSDSKLKKISSDELFVLDGNRYSPFKPLNTTDFLEKKEYGRIEGSTMVMHYILHMTDTLDEINKLMSPSSSQRLHNPKRQSTTPPTIPLSKLEYSSSSQRKQVKAHTLKEKTDRGEQLLKQYDKMSQDDEKSASSSKKRKAQELVDDNEKSASSSKKRKAQELVDDDESCSKIIKKSGTLEPCWSCVALNRQANIMEGKVESLLLALEHSRDETAKEVTKLEELISELTAVLQTSHELQTKMEEVLEMQKKEAQPNSSSKRLVDLKDATGQETKTAVPEGKVHVGDNVFISQEDIIAVERDVFKFTLRVNKLCEVIWLNAVHEMSLSGGSKAKIEEYHLKKKSDETVKAIGNLLNAMTWDSDELPSGRNYFSNREIRDQIRRYTSRRREIVAVSQLTKEQKEIALKEKQKRISEKEKNKKIRRGSTWEKKEKETINRGFNWKKNEKIRRGSRCRENVGRGLRWEEKVRRKFTWKGKYRRRSRQK